MKIVYEGIGIPYIYGESAFMFPADCLDNTEFLKWNYGSEKSKITIKDYRSFVRDAFSKIVNVDDNFATLFVASYDFPVKIRVVCEHSFDTTKVENHEFDIETEIFIMGCEDEQSDNVFNFGCSDGINSGIPYYENSICRIVNRVFDKEDNVSEWWSFEVGKKSEMF